MSENKKGETKQEYGTTLSNEVYKKPVVMEDGKVDVQEEESTTLDSRIAQMEKDSMSVSNSDTSLGSKEEKEEVKENEKKEEKPREDEKVFVSSNGNSSIEQAEPTSRKTLYVFVAGVAIGALLVSMFM